MAITAQLVKELRERTGAGMMECKKALVSTEGDIEKAIDEMRKSGMAKAGKKAGRVAAEGAVRIARSADEKTAFIIEVNSETDFVARDQSFEAFVKTVAERGLAEKAADVESLGALPYEADQATTIEETRKSLISTLGENIQIRRCALIDADTFVGEYIHGGRIAVLVDLSVANDELAKNIAMHIAATNPQAISADDVPQSVLDKEREIFIAQAEQSGKPADIIEKMVTGRINKFVKEVSLLDQPYVKNPEETVSALLKTENAIVNNFVRFEVGEGIEKKEEDFAQEVMAQARGQ